MRNVELKSEFIRYSASDWAFFRKARETPPPPITNYICESDYFIKNRFAVYHVFIVS
jgi:hypothetical protein